MNESILNSLMNLYALIAYANKDADSVLARSFVESYLKQYYSKKVSSKQLELFDFHLQNVSKKHNGKADLKSSFSLQILQICEQINKELHQKQKLLVLINALQFIKHWRAFSVEGFENEKIVSEILDTIALVFKFNEQEFANIKYFIYDQLYKIVDKKNILLVNDGDFFPVSGISIYSKSGVPGNLFILYVESTNTYLFRYNGKEKLELSGKMIFSNQVNVFEKGTSLKGEYFPSVYYSEIVAQYLLTSDKLKISFEAKNIEFKFPNSENGIREFSFTAYSGQLIGVMGGSGTGKSTLLNVLNGNLALAKGEILINGLNIKIEKDEIKGVIGHIPQDDLLIEELTVYQNLYYNTKLCYGDLSEEELYSKIQNLLLELELWDSKDLKVGNPLKNFISGGQRKRLNIALELIRKPSVLFVDEPTSGLSSADSEKVIELLKEETLKGNLLMVNIHQPSSVIFKQFDKLIVLDKGGYPIYFGDPIDAISYFKKATKRVDAAENECHCCGNVNPDEILDLVELKDVDEFGEYSKDRKIGPLQWYGNYKIAENQKREIKISKNELPQSSFKVPNKWSQFIIFSKRNLFTKLADKQFLVISLLVSPVLALLLSFLTRYLITSDDNTRQYLFYYNENIPSFLLMSIIVSLFVGLTISAEEIIRDLKILKRESFLNLSRISYLNSKILFLFLLSAFQGFTYVIIAGVMLELKGFMFTFWLVFFSLSFFGNLTGLNISSGFKSVVTIYILIPLILVPQILLSGVIVKFDKLHPSITSIDKVPLVGDLMASRWAYEALLVNQFKSNKYQKNFYEINKDISEASFIMNYKIPEFLSIVNILIKNSQYDKTDNKNGKYILTSELDKIIGLYYLPEPEFMNDLKKEHPEIITLNEAKLFTTNLKYRLSKYVDESLIKKDIIYTNLINNLGKKEVDDLKLKYTNERISEFVLNSKEIKRLQVTDSKMIQLYEPIYLTPDSNIGRAHFYAPHKILGNFIFDTLWFNLMIIWMFIVILYLALLNEWLRKFMDRLDKLFVKKF